MRSEADASLVKRVHAALSGHDDTAEVFIDGGQLRVVTRLASNDLAELLARADLPLMRLDAPRDTTPPTQGCGCGGCG